MPQDFLLIGERRVQGLMVDTASVILQSLQEKNYILSALAYILSGMWGERQFIPIGREAQGMPYIE